MKRQFYQVLFIIMILVIIPITSHGATQTWTQQTEFNFHALVVQTSTTITSKDILENNSNIKSIFKFDTATQSFVFNIKLANDSILGTSFDLAPGTGYICECTDSGTVGFSGTIFSNGADIDLKTDFNLIGFPELVTAPKASELLTNNSALNSIFRWDAASQTFKFILKLTNGDSFGDDFTLNHGESYFFKSTSDFTINLGTIKDTDGPTGPNDVVAGINHMTASSGTFTADAKYFGSSEELIAILYTKATSDTYSSFTVAGSEQASAAPAKPDVATYNYYGLKEETVPNDSRMRYMENISAKAMQNNGGGVVRAPLRAAQHNLNDKVNFWCLNSLAWPPGPSDWTLVTATCRAIGNNCYLFEDDTRDIGYSQFPSEAWPVFRDTFDNTIYPTNTSTFGSEPKPGIDGDEKVYVLFSHNVNKQNASGYFDSTQQLTTAQVATIAGGTYYTNQKEMFYMQVPSTSYSWGDSLRDHVLSVLAHEFLHMIVYNQHVYSGGSTVNEEDWVNEGLAQVAQDQCGYGYQKGNLSYIIQPYLSDPDSYSLTNFTFSLGQYGAAYLFFRFIADKGANLKSLASTTLTGVNNVQTVTGKQFGEWMRLWTTALYVSNNNDYSGTSEYSYTNLNLRATQADDRILNGPAITSHTTSFPVSYNSNLRGASVKYVKITGGSGKTVNFTATDTGSGELGLTILRK